MGEERERYLREPLGEYDGEAVVVSVDGDLMTLALPDGRRVVVRMGRNLLTGDTEVEQVLPS